MGTRIRMGIRGKVGRDDIDAGYGLCCLYIPMGRAFCTMRECEKDWKRWVGHELESILHKGLRKECIALYCERWVSLIDYSNSSS
jgi:hypothetical protein